MTLTRSPWLGPCWGRGLSVAALTLMGLVFLFLPAGDAGPTPRLVAGTVSEQPGFPDPDGNGRTSYTWQDGDRTVGLRLLSSEEIAQRAASVETADDGRQPIDGESVPVFLADSGDHTMVLAGGALVALEPSWTVSEAVAFFSRNGISSERLTAMTFAENAYLVDAPPGLPSLELANVFAGQAGVVSSVPNWEMDVETLQDSGQGGVGQQDDHGDTNATATYLPLDTPTSGIITDENDVDVFRFVLTASTFVVVTDPKMFEAYARGGTGPGIELFDSDDNRLGTGGTIGIRLPAGTYYVSVLSVAWFSAGNYKLEVRTIPDHSDTMANAQPVDVWVGRMSDQPARYVEFHSTNDVDFFKLELEETTEVKIHLWGLNLWRWWWGMINPYNLAVLDSDGNYVRTPTSGMREISGYYRLDAGTYYIRLSPYFLRGHWYSVYDPSIPDQNLFGNLYVTANVEYTEFIERCSAISTAYDDPLYGCQWQLENTTENPGTPGEDINVAAAWSTTQGAGVNVAIVDDAAEFDHPDLEGNWNSQLSHDYLALLTRTPDPWARHGLGVAGIIAAQGNSIGLRGVAPQATIYGYNMTERPTLANAVDALTRNSVVTAVSNNSWIFSNDHGIRSLPEVWNTALETGIRDGYHGKGTFYVFGAGNDHLNGSHVNLNEGKNYHAQTLACAVGPDGKRAEKSETGYSLWLCAPEASVTTYLYGRYSEQFGGTSAASAVVSGVGALLRSANASLTWRDLKIILASSARKNDAADPGWETGAYQYGSNTERYSYNSQYGFGVVDAGAAVGLASNWTNLPAMKRVAAYSPTEEFSIPDGSGETISSEIVLDTDITFTEFVEVKVDITHPAFRDLGIMLTSPSGATSHLAVPSGAAPDGGLNAKFRLGSARHLGENPSGVWKLEIEDHESGDAGSFKGWELTVFGHRGAVLGNSPATGQPGVSGTPQVGQVLTASTSAIADPDGLTNVAFTYQWMAGDTIIRGATAAAYSPVAADVGKVVKVRFLYRRRRQCRETVQQWRHGRGLDDLDGSARRQHCRTLRENLFHLHVESASARRGDGDRALHCIGREGESSLFLLCGGRRRTGGGADQRAIIEGWEVGI